MNTIDQNYIRRVICNLIISSASVIADADATKVRNNIAAVRNNAGTFTFFMLSIS